MMRTNSEPKSTRLLNVPVIGTSNPEDLSKKLRMAATGGMIDVRLCLEAANLIDNLVQEACKPISLQVELKSREIEYIVIILLKIRRKSHQKILIYLMKNAGKVVDSNNIAQACGANPSTIKVHISHLRSCLKKIGLDDLIRSIRSSNSCADNGYMVMIDQLKALVHRNIFVNC